MSVHVGVDLGKTGCRVRIVDAGSAFPEVEGAGTPGLAEPDGVAAAAQTVTATVTRAWRAAEATPMVIDRVAIGTAGATAAPDAATRLATELARRLDAAEVAVASDALTSHVGALGGATGVALAVGTGAVAIAVGSSGQLTGFDGWGPWLGDDGGGAWIGREGLRAALRRRERRSPATTLTEAAERRYGDLVALPAVLAHRGQPARDTAAFAPDVVGCAVAGDEVATDILRRAGLALADVTMAAIRHVDVHLVCAVGGLAGVEPLMEVWRKALADDIDVVPARGTALDGALMLAERRDLPHEAAVIRLRQSAAQIEVPAVHHAAAPAVDDFAVLAVDDVDVLETERVRQDLHDLDTRSPEELVDLLLEAEAAVPRALADARAELAHAVRLVSDAFDHGGRLIYVGAGTPGRLAAVDAAECPPTFGTSPDQVVAVLAGGREAAAAAVEGAEDDAAAGVADLEALDPTAADVVVGISASGRTPYMLGALKSARWHGARTIAVVNNRGSAARAFADVTIELLTGPEVLAGSTRLKAGTSQKVALNILSTSAMIRTGKSYGARMVDVVASNEKLRRRAQRIVREVTNVDDGEAMRVLQESAWHPKVALVMILGRVDAGTARTRVEMALGRVRDALRVKEDG